MTPMQLLMECRRRGIELSVNGDKLRVVADPQGAVTDELREALRRHKPALMELLRGPTAEDVAEATRQLHARGWALLDSAALGEQVALCRDVAAARQHLDNGTVAFAMDEVMLVIDANLPAGELHSVIKAKLLVAGVMVTKVDGGTPDTTWFCTALGRALFTDGHGLERIDNVAYRAEPGS
ncbi:MAG: hypothetical protein ACOX4G_01875 [Limnochordia bacterium]